MGTHITHSDYSSLRGGFKTGGKDVVSIPAVLNSLMNVPHEGNPVRIENERMGAERDSIEEKVEIFNRGHGRSGVVGVVRNILLDYLCPCQGIVQHKHLDAVHK
jgi:hypothetical protein